MKSCEYQANSLKYNVCTIRSMKKSSMKEERAKECSRKNENNTRLTENNRIGINRPYYSFKSQDYFFEKKHHFSIDKMELDDFDALFP